MSVGSDATFLDQVLEWLAFPHRIVAADVGDGLGINDEKAAVYVVGVFVGFLAEPHDEILAGREMKHAETAGRPHGGHRHQRSGALVESDQLADVDVGDAVPVGEAERLIVEIGQGSPDATARHGLLAGIQERHPPGLDPIAMVVRLTCVEVERDVRPAKGVVAKVLLDEMAFVAAEDDELVEPVGRVHLHDVPEDRLSADLDKWLWSDGAFLAYPGPIAASKDDDLHACLSGSLRL